MLAQARRGGWDGGCLVPTGCGTAAFTAPVCVHCVIDVNFVFAPRIPKPKKEPGRKEPTEGKEPPLKAVADSAQEIQYDTEK